MIRATFKSLPARKLRLLLSSLSIVLGVSFVAGAFVLTDSLGKVFDDLFTTISKNVAVDVRGDKVTTGQPGRRPRPAAARTSSTPSSGVDGVKEAQGQVQGSAQLVDKDGKVVGTGGAPTFGFNWYDSDAAAERHRSSKGRAPTGPDEIAINQGLLDRTDYKIGDSAPVLTDAPAEDLQASSASSSSTASRPSPARPRSSSTRPTAQQVLNLNGKFTEITVAADGGVSETELRDRMRRRAARPDRGDHRAGAG